MNDNQFLLASMLGIGLVWLWTGKGDRLRNFIESNRGSNPFDNFERTGQEGSRAAFGGAVEQWRPAVRAQLSSLNVSPRISEDLVLSVIAQESGGDPTAIGGVGEKGLMQMREIAVEDVTGVNELPPDDPAAQIRLGIQFLDLQIRRMDNDIFDGLRAYNAGETGARRSESNGRSYAESVLSRIA